MFISVTFPVADFRVLHREQAGRLKIPAWGSSDPRAKFARGFGGIHTRTKSGDGFIGENYYADCQNFIRYPNLKFIEPLHNRKRPVLAYPIYRRFFFDGMFAGRFELGFRLNEASLREIRVYSEMREQPVLFDPVAISRQMLESDISLHLLDDRVEVCPSVQSQSYLRDGYLLSSTRSDALSEYDIATVGSRYVGVGAPFVVIRAASETPLLRQKRMRPLLERHDMEAFAIPSGVDQQNFDTIVIKSLSTLNAETAHERLVRLVYTQLRTLLFAHKFYLDGHDDGTMPKSSGLQQAISVMLDRMKALAPLEGDRHDAETCAMMAEIVKRFDVDLAKLADEVASHLKPSWFRRNVGRIFGYLDKKGDIAIEAASTAATQKLLGGS
ncbi:hypothetical protein GFM11_33460 [Rhizobium leguminosarum bv. viciae]|uniref:hypothetical protein n=1 Tax=Rhizobium leguminosarum TaxID=384 RepID=UPI001441C9F8|nr:hypothetical protein [Rhizobium leguminosarum]NKK18065.1 hypothetical protein [Rhizobium leguminosarum bv. viciae]